MDEISHTPRRRACIALKRTVRAGVARRGGEAAQASSHGRGNGFAGIPPCDGFAAHHEITVECRGVPDGRTGYLLGIQAIDAIVRRHGWPILESAFRSGASPTGTVRALGEGIAPHLPPAAPLSALQWAPSPFFRLSWSPSMPEHAVVTEEFEFSASHRLHCPELDAAENLRLFGKCNHPGGHGHNYRLAVSVRVSTGLGSPAIAVGELERLVDLHVLSRFDHRHLNADCPEFSSLNPSVENIAMVCHGLLQGPVRDAGAELDRVTVWETSKTSATYPGG